MIFVSGANGPFAQAVIRKVEGPRTSLGASVCRLPVVESARRLGTLIAT